MRSGPDEPEGYRFTARALRVGCLAVGFGFAASSLPLMMTDGPLGLAVVAAGVATLLAIGVGRALRRGLVPPVGGARVRLAWAMAWPFPPVWLYTFVRPLTMDDSAHHHAGGDDLAGAELLALLTWLVMLGAILYAYLALRPPVPPAPPARRPGAHLTRTERRVLARAIRSGEGLDATRDRDLRAVIHRVLDLEILGWAAVVAGSAVLVVAVLVTDAPWWARGLLVVVGLVAAALAVRVLTLVAAAKRRQGRLNVERPAPHLERTEQADPRQPPAVTRPVS